MSYPTLPPPIQNAAKDPAIADMAKAIRGASVAAWLIAGMLGLVIVETHVFAILSVMAVRESQTRLKEIQARNEPLFDRLQREHIEKLDKAQESIDGRKAFEAAPEAASAAISRMLSEDPTRPRQSPSR